MNIKIYPLFGAWRAECLTCGNYSNSNAISQIIHEKPFLKDHFKKEGRKYSPILGSLDNFNFSYCKHNKSLIILLMDYNHLFQIEEDYNHVGYPNFPKINIGNNQLNIELFNFPQLDYNWSPASYCFEIQKQEGLRPYCNYI